MNVTTLLNIYNCKTGEECRINTSLLKELFSNKQLATIFILESA
jgi:hypothetical protein